MTGQHGPPIVGCTTGEPGLASSGEREVGEAFFDTLNPALPPTPRTELPGYVLANLTGKLQISDHLRLNARIENILDTEYATAANFRMQERSGFVELSYK